MTFDASKMAMFAAKSVDDLEEIFSEFPQAELGEILVVVEVKNLPDPEGSDTPGTSIRYSCTDGRFWVARGLLESALDTI